MQTKRSTMRWLAGFCSFIGAGAMLAPAATIQWSGGTGGAGTAWQTASNWSPTNYPPNTNDTAEFSTVGTAVNIGINMNTAPGGTQQVGAISLLAGTNRIIENNSTVSSGTLRFNGTGASPAAISNASSTASLHFRNSGTTNPVLMRLLLNTNLELFVNAGGAVTVSNSVVAELGGARRLTKSGGGVLTLGATNLYSGGTVIAGGPTTNTAGAIRLLSYSALGGGDVIFSNAANLTPLFFAGNAGTLSNAIQLSSGGGFVTRFLGASGTGTVAQLAGPITGGNPAQELRFDSDAAGGTSRIRLSNPNNTFQANPIYLFRGGLIVDSDGALGDAANTLVLDTTSYNNFTGLILGSNLTLSAGRSIAVPSVTRIDSQSFTGTVSGAVTNSSRLVKVGAGGLVFDGPVSGAGGFTVEQGTLVLNAANTLGGLHTNAATIALGADDAAGTGQIDQRGAGSVIRSADTNARAFGNNLNIATDTTFGSPATGDLTVNGAAYNNGGGAKRLAISNNVTTFNGVFNNNGVITKSGPGSMVLNSAGAMRSPFIIAEGPVVLGASATLPSVPVITVSNGASLDVSVPTLVLSGVSNQVLRGFGVVTGQVSVGNGAEIHAGLPGMGGTLTIDGIVALGSGVTNTFDLTNNLAIGGGNDLLVFNGANFEPSSAFVRITPLVPLTSGTYRLVNYTGSKFTTFATPVLGNTTRSTWTLDETTPGEINLDVQATNAALVWSANESADWDLGTSNWTVIANSAVDRYFDGDAVLFDDTGAASNFVAITTAVRPLAVTVDSSSNYTLGGVGYLADYPGVPLQVLKRGTGWLTVVNVNSNAGPVVISNGVLQIGNGAGATNGGGNATLGGSPFAVSAPGTLAFFRTNNAYTIPNVIAGDGAVVFRGRGASSESGYALGANNTSFAGTMIVTNARLNLNAATQFGGSNQTIVVQDGGSLYHSSGTFGSPLSIAGLGWTEAAGRLGALRVDNANWTGPVTLAGDARISAYSGNGTVSGLISGPHELELWNGSATARALTLTPPAQNAYAALRISSNIVVVAGNADAFGTGPVILNGGTQRLAGFSFAFSNLSSTAAGGTIANQAANTCTVTIGLDGTSTTYGGIFENTGAGGINVTKVGAGTLTLNGANRNSGDYTIQDGTIALGAAGAITNAAATVVLAGGTFDVTAKPSGYSFLHAIRGNGTVSGALHLAAADRFRPGDAAVPGTIALSGSLDMTATNVLTLDLTNSTVVGSGINDLIAIEGGLEPSNSVLAVNTLAPLVSGTNTVITYTGTKLTSFDPAVRGNATRKTWTLDESVAGQINLIVSGDYSTLTWRPQTSGAWDLATSNWINTVGSNTDRFYQADAVVFDDTGAYSGVVTLATTLLPASVQVDTASNYTWTGAGKVSGNAGLTKSGAGLLTISNANDFSGLVLVSNGILKVGNANALGSSNGGTVVVGGTVDLQNQALMAGGERFLISGTGVNSTGAVIATGANQQNALRYLALADDASIGAWPVSVRWDIRGPGGSGSYNAELDLNGSTLTKVGPGRVSLVDTTVTNAGSIIVNGGALALTRNLIAGPGALALQPATTLYIENHGIGSLTKTITMDGATITNVGNSFSIGSQFFLTNANTFSVGFSLTLTNVVSGSGSLVKLGASNLVLAADNTYGGGTLVSGGTLIIGAGGTSGSVLGGITNNATLMFSRSDALTLDGGISGVGNLYVNVASGLVVHAGSPITGRQSIQVPYNGAGAMIVQPGASIDCTNLHLGNQANFPGLVTQHGGDVVVGANLRVAHWPNETSIYRMGGGTLTITNNPGVPLYTTGTTEQPGALYIGIDGTGLFIQTGGVVRCAGVVLDNRGDTAGTDTLVLEGGALQIGRWGITSDTNTTRSVLLGGATLGAYDHWTNSVPAQLTGTNGNTIVAPSTYTITMNGALSGTGGLVKADAGMLLLAASNSYSGPTDIQDGYLFGTGSVNSAVTVHGGGTLGVQPVAPLAGRFTIASSLQIASNGVLSALLQGTGATIQVTGDVTNDAWSVVQVVPQSPATPAGTHVLLDYDGTFTGNTADFVLAAVPNGGGGYLTNNTDNTSIDLVITNAGAGIVWDGAVDGTWQHGGPQNWKAILSGATGAYCAFDSVLFDDSASGVTAINLAEVVAPSSLVVSNETLDYIWTGGGISGGAGLQKTGAGALTLVGGAMTFTNTTTVSGGLLTLDSLSAWNSSIANASTVELAAAAGVWATGNGRTFSGGVFRKTGAGVVTIQNGIFSGSSLWSIEGGVLRNDGNGSSWNANTSDLAVAAGAALDMRADPVRFNVLTGSGTITNSWGNTAIELLTVGVDHGSGVFAGVIQDSGRVGTGQDNGTIGLLKTGTGTQTLAGVNNYMGSTLLDGGTLRYTADNPYLRGLVIGATPSSTNISTLDLTGANVTASGFTNQVNSLTTNLVLIGADKTLTITGSVTIGSATTNSYSAQRMAGGAFVVASAGATVRVGHPTPSNSYATLDLSGVGRVDVDLGTNGSVIVGAGENQNTPRPFTLLLGATNSVAAQSINVGPSGQGNQQSLILGSVSNRFHVDTFNAGTGSRDRARIVFGGATGSLVLRDRSGAGRAAFNFGRLANDGTGYFGEGLVDLRGHDSDLLIGTLNIGYAGRGGWTTNTFWFDTGILDATGIRMAHLKTNGNNVANFFVGGGAVNIGAGGLIIASNAVGRVALTGGVVTCAGGIAKGNAGTGTATLTLDGASLDLQGSAIGGVTAVDNLELLSGTLANVAEINAGGVWNKSGAGVLAIAGANGFTGPGYVSNGTLLVNGSIGGAGVVTVAGGTLGGTGSIAGIVVQNAGSVAPGASAGLLSLLDDYAQIGGSLDIEIAGTNSASQYDVLSIGGQASLGGTLNVTTNGYVPAAGDSFTILAAASGISGTFSLVNLPPLSSPELGWQVSYMPTSAPTMVILSVTGVTGATGYDAWAAQITNGLTNFNDSALGDGYPNLLKYATGSNPTNADNLARMDRAVTNGVFALRFNRNTNATDVTLIVEGAFSATNEATWNGIATNSQGSWGGAANVNETGTGSPVNVTVQDAIPAATNRFLRLRVTRP